jgi:hypothetical protein
MLSLFAAAVLAPDPKGEFLRALDFYRSRPALEFRLWQTEAPEWNAAPIRHARVFRRRADGRFELVYAPDTKLASLPGARANAYFDGKRLTRVYLDRRDAIDFDPKRMTFAVDELSDLLVSAIVWNWHPGQDGSPVRWSWGPQKTWQGQPVREIVVSIPDRKDTFEFSIFLDPELPQVLGQTRESGADGQGWVRYTNQKFDAPLPASVGTPPKG